MYVLIIKYYVGRISSCQSSHSAYRPATITHTQIQVICSEINSCYKETQLDLRFMSIRTCIRPAVMIIKYIPQHLKFGSSIKIKKYTIK
jgi:hypothetical protein